MPLFNGKSRVLAIAGLLTGCQTNFDHFDRFYHPAATREDASVGTAQPRATPPQLLYSRDPDKDGKILRQVGYVLIGTTSFNGAPGLSYVDRAVVVQGQKVGAAIVLLRAHSNSTLTSCCAPDASFVVSSRGGTSYFASYWARPDIAKTSAP